MPSHYSSQAVHRRRTHSEKAREDLHLTSRQRSLRQRTQHLRYPLLALARQLASTHRATLQLNAVARSKIPNNEARVSSRPEAVVRQRPDPKSPRSMANRASWVRSCAMPKHFLH